LTKTLTLAAGIAVVALLAFVAIASAHAEGTATVTRTADGLQVEMDITGLDDNTSHANHIHGGTCDSPEGVVATLDVLTADDSGDATATTAVTETDAGEALTFEDVADGGHVIVIHQGTDLDDPEQHERIGCGAIPAANGADSVTVEIEAVEGEHDEGDEHAEGMPHSGTGGYLGQDPGGASTWLISAAALAAFGITGLAVGTIARRARG
jgi:hypothetical protein